MTSQAPTDIRSSWNFVPYVRNTRQSTLTNEQENALLHRENVVVEFPASPKGARESAFYNRIVNLLKSKKITGWEILVNAGHKKGDAGAFQVNFTK